MKILFLDIDGVLNNHTSGTMYLSGSDEHYGIDENNVQQLLRILRNTDCQIVWSTNWRNHPDDWSWGNEKHQYHSPFPALRKRFKNFVHKDSEAPHTDGADKAYDIACWIQNHRKELENGCIVILDDMSNQRLDVYGSCFKKTDPNFGLTEMMADQIIKFFNDH